jgi:hypothetical protein
MAATIDELQIEIQANATKASAGIDALIASLSGLKGVTKGGAGLTTATKQFERFSAAVNAMQNPSAKVAALVSALKPLESIGKSNLSSALNQLKKIPEITAGLDNAKLVEFAAKITQVTAAIRPLAAEMEKVSQGFSKLPANIQRAINANARLTSSNYKAQSSFFKLSNIMAKVYVVKRIAGVIGGWIKESNDYVENLNLFTVALGEYAEEAVAYANKVGDVMGIDPSEWMRSQGVLSSVAKGFGIAGDQAAFMSKNLTQLGYDISSLYNESYQESMLAVQSAFAGEPEPIRRRGWDISVATLQEIAYANGIEKRVAVMTQGEKAQLRYIALMTQMTHVQGDMARTLQAPANQLRILQAQATQAARALGNIFIPALNAILPYAIAFLKIVRMVAQSLAELFGFSMPEIDYSGLEGVAAGGEDAEDALGGAAGAAKKLKGMLAGFDEINVITQPNAGGGGGGGGVGGIGGGDLGLALPEYDFLGGAIESQVDKIMASLEPAIEWLKKNIDTIWGMIVDIGIAMLAWKIGKSVVNGISSFLELAKNFSKLAKAAKVAAGLLIAIVGVKWSYEGGFAIGQGQAEFMDVVKSILGPIAAGVGGALIGSAIMPGVGTAAGFVIGFTVGAVAEIVGIIAGVKAARDEAEYQRVVQSLKDNAAMAVTDAISLFSAWYNTWAPDNRVVIDLIAAKEDTAQDIETAYSGLQKTFDLIMEDGVLAKGELEKLTEAMNAYFKAITADTSANNDIIHEALVGALGRASADGKQYYQDLIDKHNEWIITEQGALGALQQQANDAAGALAIAAPGTQEYADALNAYNTAMGKLADYTNAENTAKLQTYSEKITALKDAISSGTLDTSQLATAQEQLSTLGGKMQTLLTDIETAKENVTIAVQTEINRATMFGDADSAVALGDIKTALEKDFETQKEGVIEFANGIGATIAAAIGGQMFNLAQTTDEGTIQRLVNEQYKPLLESWVSSAGVAITNSEELKKFPQLLLDSMFPKAVGGENILDQYDYLLPAEDIVANVKGALDHVLKTTGLGDQAQAFIDGLTSGMTTATVSPTDMNTAAGNVVSGFDTAAGIESPAKIMYPSGESMTAGIMAGMIDSVSAASIKTGMSTLSGMTTTGLDTAFKIGQNDSLFTGKGKSLVTDIATGITNNSGLVTNSFKSVLNGMIDLMERFTGKIATALNGMLSDFASTMKSMSISANGTVSYNRMSGVSISGFAAGGYPVPGELFFARESGPEMVGSVNGRTAVANNDQIVEAVSQGVYRAVSDAMSGQQGSGDVYVYIGGEQIDAMVTRAQGRSAIRSNGRSL